MIAGRFRRVNMKKRKKKVLDIGQVARRKARESGLAPAVTRVIADKRKQPPKHKRLLLDEDLAS